MAIFFTWLLRESAARAGHHESPAKAKEFYRRIATEIDAACGSEGLVCGPPRRSHLPELRPRLLPIAFSVWWSKTRDLWELGNPVVDPRKLPRVRATDEELAVFEEVLSTTPADTLEGFEAKIAALERLVGRQALEIEFQKGALKHAPRPKSGSTSVIAGPQASPLQPDAD